MANNIRRIGNWGIADTSHGLVSFSVGSAFTGFDGVSSYNFGLPSQWQNQYMQIGKYQIVPMGLNNSLPNELQQLFDELYHGEGLLAKIQGLQWGEGPELYEKVYNDDGAIIKKFKSDPEVFSWLKSWKYDETLLRMHTDLVHGLGFFYKVFRNRGFRIGAPARIARIEHVQVDKARLEYPRENQDYPSNIIVGNFPNPDINRMADYPIWLQDDPFKYNVSMGYQSIYSFCKWAYSTPQFYGALSWMKIASRIAPLLTAYNENATAISFHIESPQTYWEDAKERIENNCRLNNIPYTDKMLEEYKDKTFEEFTKALSGQENAGKFLHTISEWLPEAADFAGWKIIPIDKKIKEYVDAQIAIANKADSAATSGFGLPPSLSNIVIEGKMSSGSEMLYAMKGYFASQVAIPEMILFAPINAAIEANFPGKNLKMGFYRNIVMKESEVSPSKRIMDNA